MKAIEFMSHLENGKIQVPHEYLENLQKDVRVIILIDEKPPKTKKAAPKRTLKAFKVKTKGLKFSREEANER